MKKSIEPTRFLSCADFCSLTHVDALVFSFLRPSKGETTLISHAEMSYVHTLPAMVTENMSQPPR